MLKKIISCWAAVACAAAALSASAQTPTTLNLQLFAGVNITGTNGSVYAIQSTTDLAQTNSWTTLALVQLSTTNYLFVDTSKAATNRGFYRAMLQSNPGKMVFIPPGTFTMGSPTNELFHQPEESPQTTVILTQGFWINQYEVFEAEYVSIMNTNPSFLPDDLSRAVSSVSWLDATNYCAKLTQRDLASGKIPAGTAYRLPTEAEWEYAARAGTSSRFSYGDDVDAVNLTDHAWYAPNANGMVHPVGQKPPNAWGLYDTEGNVFEWCQDWFGPLAGGIQINPQGPPQNQLGTKVMRGGSYDFGEIECRSAARNFFGVSPFLTDTDLGFRVVLAVSP